MTAVYPGAVLQWEDLLKGNAIAQLERFRDRLCTFNDDIQGTAAVVLAGLYAALRLTGGTMGNQRVVLAGAGASAQGIAELILRRAGRRRADGRGGAATLRDGRQPRPGVAERPELEPFKARFARPVGGDRDYACRDRGRDLALETIANFRPTILLGTSGTAGLFTEEVVRAMAAAHPRPVVFPLSNPTSMSECTAEQAVAWSDGRAIVATGSPFAPVPTRPDAPHRAVQQRIRFPGVGLGLWVGRVRRVTEAMFLDAAKALAAQVTNADLAAGAVYPELARIRDCSRAVACAVINRAVLQGHANPSLLRGLEERSLRAMWRPEYRPLRYEPASCSPCLTATS